MSTFTVCFIPHQKFTYFTSWSFPLRSIGGNRLKSLEEKHLVNPFKSDILIINKPYRITVSSSNTIKISNFTEDTQLHPREDVQFLVSSSGHFSKIPPHATSTSHLEQELWSLLRGRPVRQPERNQHTLETRDKKIFAKEKR